MASKLKLEEMTVCLFSTRRVLMTSYSAAWVKGEVNSLPRSSKMSRSQVRYRRVSAPAWRASSPKRMNLRASKRAKTLEAVS